MIALIIGSGFRLGIKAWERGEAEAHETQRLRVLSGLISQSVKSAYPYRLKMENKDITVFEGDANSVLFVTSSVSSSGEAFKWVRYFYKDGTFFFAEGRLPDKDLLDKIAGKGEIIDSAIGEITFEYLPSTGDEWREKWDLGDGIPVAVRVRIGYFQPFLITIPMGQTDSGEGI